jgi:hypothetical protein
MRNPASPEYARPYLIAFQESYELGLAAKSAGCAGER